MTLATPMPGAVEEFLITQYGNTRIAKLRGLFSLARSVVSGCIVELGVWQGRGLLALAFGTAYGAGVPVWGVDRWTISSVGDRRYGPMDRRLCLENLDAARALGAELQRPVNPTLIWGDALEVAHPWTCGGIGLIHWDVEGDLPIYFGVWGPHLLPGGLFAIHDTTARKYGSDGVIASALEKGYELVTEDDESSLYVVRRGAA